MDFLNRAGRFLSGLNPFGGRDDEEERRRRSAPQRSSSRQAPAPTPQYTMPGGQAPQPGTIFEPPQKADVPSLMDQIGTQGTASNPVLNQNPEALKKAEAQQKKDAENQRSIQKSAQSGVRAPFSAAALEKADQAIAKQKDAERKERHNQESNVEKYKRAMESTYTGGMRLGVGNIQAAAGLFDLLTPGEGNNRITKLATRQAENIDQRMEDKDLKNFAYHGSQVAGEVAQALATGGATKAASSSKFAANLGSRAPSKVSNVASRVSTGIQKNAKDGLIKRGLKATAREAVDPTNVGVDAYVVGTGLGGTTARDEQVTPRRILEELSLGGASAGLSAGLRKLLSKSTTQGVRQAIDKPLQKAPDSPSLPGSRQISPDTPHVEVAPGVKSSNLADPEINNRPAYQRGFGEADTPPLNKTNEQLSVEANLRRQGYSPDEMTPAYLRKAEGQPAPDLAPEPTPRLAEQIAQTPDDAIIANLNQSVSGNPARAIPELEPAPLQRAVDAPEPMARPDVDAQGNPLIESDAQLAAAAAEQGIPIQPGRSVVESTEEGLQAAAERTAREQVSGQQQVDSYTRFRQEMADQLMDQDIANMPSKKSKLSLEDAKAQGKAIVDGLDDSQIIARYGDSFKVESPTQMKEAHEAMYRLDAIRRQALQNGDDALALKASDARGKMVASMDETLTEGAQTMRASQVLYDELDSVGKASYIEKKMGVDLSDSQRDEVLRFIDKSETYGDNARQSLSEWRQIFDDVKAGRISSPEDVAAKTNRLQELDEIIAVNEESQGQFLREAIDYIESARPDKSKIADIGNTGRSLMLTAPSGRAFDVLSTNQAAIGDVAAQNISAGVGKVINKFKGAGRVADTMLSPTQYAKGSKQGFSDLKKAFKGKESIKNPSELANPRNRGELRRSQSLLNRVTRTGVMTADASTRGLKDAKLQQLAIKEGKRAGLSGDNLKLFAKAYERVPDARAVREAETLWKKANMMHDNVITKKLDGYARSFEGRDNKAARAAGGIVRNAVLPFTRFFGGSIHRALTDKNILYTSAGAVNRLRKGDLQGFSDYIGKSVVNTAEITAVGMTLANTGLLTEDGPGGNNYDGLYLALGDRRIPVAFTGPMAGNLIAGYAVNEFFKDVENGNGNVDSFISNSVDFTLKSLQRLGVTSFLGGQNPILRAGQDMLKARDLSDKDDRASAMTDAVTESLGSIVGQYIPAVTGDVNSLLDNYTGLNPTKEAPDPVSKNYNPDTGREKTDKKQTALNRIQARIPFAAQNLPRKDGSPARDPLDRITKGTRSSEEQQQQRASEMSLQDMHRSLKKDGISTADGDINNMLSDGNFDNAIRAREFNLARAKAKTNASKSDIQNAEDKLTEAKLAKDGVSVTKSGIDARMSRGEYDSAIKGMEYQLKQLKRDPDATAQQIKSAENSIARTGIYRDGKYEPGLVTAYEKTRRADGAVTVTDWRNMMRSGDPEAVAYAKRLSELDHKLLDAGVINSLKYNTTTGRGGGRGGRGGRGGSARILTNPAMLSSGGSGGSKFSPLKAQGAAFAPRQTGLPQLEKVPNYDQSKLRKISVSKGRRA